MKNDKEKAHNALQYILPILEKYSFRWCISGGFACYLYGVDRPIGNIDIDIETDKDDPEFKSFIEDVKEFTKFPFQLWIDKNYDNYVMEVVIDKQLLSICTTPNLKLYNKKSGNYELFYKNGIRNPNIISFADLELPVSPKDWVIKTKEALAYKKAIDRNDILEMEKVPKN